MSTPQHLPRPIAVAILASLAFGFAANHIAARIAFDHGAGLLLALMCRSAVPVLLLGALLAWRREPISLPVGTVRWQLAFGVLIALQSFFIYSAIVRIPVALALLVVNIFPLLLVLLTWALGGERPRPATLAIMAMILLGLGMALDIPARLDGTGDQNAWLLGVSFALLAASVFAVALWITNNRLAEVHGPVRSLLAMLTVFICASAAGFGGLLPDGLSFPNEQAGWLGLLCLAIIYGTGFSLLFVWVHRLDVARNAPAMNIEPIAGLVFAWLVLGEALNLLQVAGALVVVGGILLLTSQKS